MMTPSTVSCSIDLQAPGKRIGHLRINKITNTAGWASTFIHVGCVVNGSGPTVLVLAGNHGDEYAGQLAAMRLLKELQPEQVTGRVIIIPVLSPAASKANTRTWPSGANFNRSFPGRPDGPPHEQLADYLTRVLFPMADVVIDMHSGGRISTFLPCAHMHVVENPVQHRAMLEAMEAWCSDWHYLYIDVNGNGLPRPSSSTGATPATSSFRPRTACSRSCWSLVTLWRPVSRWGGSGSWIDPTVRPRCCVRPSTGSWSSRGRFRSPNRVIAFLWWGRRSLGQRSCSGEQSHAHS